MGHLERFSVPAFLVLVLVSGCAPAFPDKAPERGLYRDLRKQVVLRESDDWVVDRVEIEEATPTAMPSACRVDADTRRRVLDWIDDRIEAAEGPARKLWAQEGDTRRFREVRRLERVQALLAHADQVAERECPYWIDQPDDFAGVQSDEGRFVVLGETVGGGALFISDGETEVGGGGAARVQGAYGISPHWTLALGAEFGGSASLVQTEDGNRGFEGNFVGALPLLFRHQAVTRMVDLEVAVTTRWRDGEARFPPGVRFGVGYGLSARRVAHFMPYLVVWAGYEVVPPDGPSPTLHVLWVGTRVGVDWDP